MANYRSLVPGGYFGNPDAPRNGLPASVWFNNPGAVNGANKDGTKVAWVQAWPGFVKTVVIGGGNPIAVFETPEQGVALWRELMRRYRDIKGKRTVQDIVNYYGGGQDYSAYVKFVCEKTGFAPSKVIDLDDDKTLTAFFRAMIHYEAGKPSPLHDDQIAYGFALGRGVQAPPVAPIAPMADDFAERLLAAMVKHNYPIDRGEGEINIVYAEGVDTDGKPNKNRRNAFDDCRVVLQVSKDNVPKILGAWEATIETGEYYTMHPIAEDGMGAARITFDYHKGVWQVGLHRGYEALVQTGDAISVYRDDDKDFSRDPGDRITRGWYGINQHHGWNAPRDDIGKHSAGCLVGRMVAGHEQFMRLVKSDPRYKANKGFKFSTTVLAQADLVEARPSPKPSAPAEAKPGPKPVKTSLGAGAAAATSLSLLGVHPYVTAIVAFVTVAVVAFGLTWWLNRKS